MRVEFIKCDRCASKTSAEDSWTTSHVTLDGTGFDLCGKCQREAIAWIRSAIKARLREAK